MIHRHYHVFAGWNTAGDLLFRRPALSDNPGFPKTAWDFSLTLINALRSNIECFFSSSKIYKSPKVEEDEVDESPDVSKTGLFYSPPKSKFVPPEGRGRINTSGSDSSITQLIIPEESGNSNVADQPEGKYSSRDARHSSRHKHRRYQKHYKAGQMQNLAVNWRLFHQRGMYRLVLKSKISLNSLGFIEVEC